MFSSYFNLEVFNDLQDVHLYLTDTNNEAIIVWRPLQITAYHCQLVIKLEFYFFSLKTVHLYQNVSEICL